jgi:hypothetical protein
MAVSAIVVTPLKRASNTNGLGYTTAISLAPVPRFQVLVQARLIVGTCSTATVARLCNAMRRSRR